jgi:16S rRNA (adenine1518-N6/adenine1519-N6)-dimethyltransferase
MNVAARPRAKKSLGQHWLTDGRYLGRIAASVDFESVDTVLEVGAGTGLLTERLAGSAKKLIAVEVDEVLAAGLRQRFAGRENVVVVRGDVMALPAEQLLEEGGGRAPYGVVGNLPYYIGSPIVRRFLETPLKPRWMVVMLQSEVAEAMAAAPGRMSYLSVQVQMYAEARVLFNIPPRAFRPAPKVRSAVVRLDVLDGPAVEVDDRGLFLEMVRAGFAAPRKQLRNSLAVGLRVKAGEVDAMLEDAGLDGSRRPAELSMEEWKTLYYGYRGRMEEGGRGKEGVSR